MGGLHLLDLAGARLENILGGAPRDQRTRNVAVKGGPPGVRPTHTMAFLDLAGVSRLSSGVSERHGTVVETSNNAFAPHRPMVALRALDTHDTRMRGGTWESCRTLPHATLLAVARELPGQNAAPVMEAINSNHPTSRPIKMIQRSPTSAARAPCCTEV